MPVICRAKCNFHGLENPRKEAFVLPNKLFVFLFKWVGIINYVKIFLLVEFIESMT